jgi:hypothetical protein
MDFFKKAFPKPNIPQKRYIAIIIGLLYAGLQFYLQNTPDKYDSEMIERIHFIAMQLLANNEDIGKQNNSANIIKQYFGEGN